MHGEAAVDDAVKVRPAGEKGLGIFARRDFRRGDLILRWEQGRIVRADEVEALVAADREHLGELTADTCHILPAPRCYANHACRPNAISTSTELHAWQAIQAGDEITIDYRLNALDDWQLRCQCGTVPGEHVVVGSFLTLPEEAQRQYLPYAPAFVQQAYRRHTSAPG
jgi:hypothetical protein